MAEHATVAEKDYEHGGVICGECGWSLGGRFLDAEQQRRQHAEQACLSSLPTEEKP